MLDIAKTMNVFRYNALITDIARYNMGEIAEQLLHSVSDREGNCVYKEVIVLAIEILLAYNKYYEVLEYLILNNDIKKGIMFLMEYWTLLKQQHKDAIKQLLCKAIINKPHKRQIIIELLEHK